MALSRAGEVIVTGLKHRSTITDALGRRQRRARRWWPRLLPLVLAASLGWLLAPQTAHAQDLSADHIEKARAAFRAAADGRWQHAHAQARATGSPLVAKAVEWFELTKGRRQHLSFDRLSDFLKNSPDWPYQNVLRARTEAAINDDIGDKTIIEWFDQFEPVTSAGKLRHAESLLRAGEAEKGREILRGLWRSGQFSMSEERRIRRSYKDVLTTSDHEARLSYLLSERRTTEAKRIMPFVSQDRQKLANARVHLMTNAPGVDYAIERVPSYLKSDTLLTFDRASWRRRRGRTDETLAMLSNLMPPALRPHNWWQERELAARYGVRNGETSLAYSVASNHGFEEGVEYAEAEWLAGWIALRFANDPKTALGHFERLFDNVRYPVSRARAAYWAGRAAAALDQRQGARRWYRQASEYVTTYYGHLARLEALAIGGLTHSRIPAPPRPSPAEKRAFYEDEVVRVVRLMGALGLNEEIDPFVRKLSLRAETPAQHVLVAEIAIEAGRQDLAVRTGRRAIREGVISLATAYPTTPPVSAAVLNGAEGSELEKVETALILSIMRQESGFKPTATSHAGARGLMQIMPATARTVARKVGVPYSRQRLREDPDYNLRLGRAYLADLLERFDGSKVLSLVAYNAGPNRADRWVREYGDPRRPEVDMIDWIEMIPFSETRNYVQRVLENLYIYRQLLEDIDPDAGLARDLHLPLPERTPFGRERSNARAPDSSPG